MSGRTQLAAVVHVGDREQVVPEAQSGVTHLADAEVVLIQLRFFLVPMPLKNRILTGTAAGTRHPCVIVAPNI